MSYGSSISTLISWSTWSKLNSIPSVLNYFATSSFKLLLYRFLVMAMILNSRFSIYFVRLRISIVCLPNSLSIRMFMMVYLMPESQQLLSHLVWLIRDMASKESSTTFKSLVCLKSWIACLSNLIFICYRFN